MRTKKPAGWPKYMEVKTVKNGLEAYYWNAPSWARKHKENPITIKSEALGNDYSAAKARCDEFLNPMLDDWKKTKDFSKEELEQYREEQQHKIVAGSFRWMAMEFFKSPNFKKLGSTTKKHYKEDLEQICSFKLRYDEDNRLFGQLMLEDIDANAADTILDALSYKEDGTHIPRNGYQCMQAARRAWNVGIRRNPKIVPKSNPFAKTGLSKPTGGEAKPATREQLIIFMATADELGHPSMATAAIISWELMIRQTDIIKYVTWSRYRPSHCPDCFEVIHTKNNGTPLPVPLETRQGKLLFADLEDRIRRTEKRGPQIIMKDKRDAIERGNTRHIPMISSTLDLKR